VIEVMETGGVRISEKLPELPDQPKPDRMAGSACGNHFGDRSFPQDKHEAGISTGAS
jgi:hypothetical protein